GRGRLYVAYSLCEWVGPHSLREWATQSRHSPLRGSQSRWYLTGLPAAILNRMFEMFEHTADLGLRIRAPDLDTLFVEAGQALFSAIVEDLATVQPLRQVEVRLPAED